MTRTALALLAIVCTAIVPMKAEGKPRPHFVGTAGPAYTDGSRYAVIRDGTGLRLRDDRQARSFHVERPAECQFADVGAGEVLWACEPKDSYPAPEQYPMVYDIASGVTQRAAGAEKVTERARASGADSVRFDEVGRHWIFGSIDGYRYYLPFWLNWRTGEYREGDQGDAQSLPDLDQPELVRRMCPPLMRRSSYDPEDTEASSA